MQAPRPSMLTMQQRSRRWQGLLFVQGHALDPAGPGSWPFAALGSVAVPVKAQMTEPRASRLDSAADEA